jgi:hypothetical protein
MSSGRSEKPMVVALVLIIILTLVYMALRIVGAIR